MTNELTAAPHPDPKSWKGRLAAGLPQIKTSLPSHIKPEKFEQVARAAIGNAPMLRECMQSNPNAVLIALSRCAADGLLPDGKLAALVPFKSQGKYNLTYIPMIAGVLQRMRNSGKIDSVTARIVYKNDHFEIIYGDDERFDHKPALTDQGDAVGAYAIIKFKDGEVYREWMSKADIMKVKNASKAKGGPWSGPFEHEMWRKTVLKRAAKYCPFSDDIQDLLDRDNDFYDPDRTIEARPSENSMVRRLEERRDQERQPRFGQDTAPDDDEPARDIRDDLDDEIPSFDEDGVIEGEIADDDAAGNDDPSDPEGEKTKDPKKAEEKQERDTPRLYRDTMEDLRNVKTRGDREEILEAVKLDPDWDRLTKSQQTTLYNIATGI